MDTLNCVAVDDDKSAQMILKRFIENTEGLTLKAVCSNATDALHFLHHEKVDLLFLDIEMPDMTGLELLSRLEKRPHVVLITGYSEYAVKAFELMADDYVVKPMSYSRFLKAVERVRAFKQLEKQSYEDSLTSLFNRRYFDATLLEEEQRFRRTRRPFSLAIADVDHFKSVNDQFSHLIGDEVLKAVGQILMTTFRKMDVVTRYGGEEFGIILPETSLEGAIHVCEKLRAAIEEYPWQSITDNLKITISIGIAESSAAEESILARADKALYQAKSSGRNSIRTAK